ncbi:helix-turn-helix domain-containing protein [Actinoplanes sp. NPDC049265]|uniref:helix-turn-helix domain-containing protein n=1 Tax=Actinoplanes sp. NPDC049265 TaxID=3363902 RepID=UPI003720EF64
MFSIGQRTRHTAAMPPAPAWAGVGACTLPETDLAVRQPVPRRLTYHLMVLATAGQGTVEVDFHTRDCRPGTVVWIRPGQALRFGGQPGLEANLVAWEHDLLTGEQLPGLTVEDAGPTASRDLTGADSEAIGSGFTRLADDCGRLDPGPVAASLIRHELVVLLLRMALIARPDGGSPPSAEGRTFARFRRALEEGHAASRRVEDYAAQLDCSVRTLTRASLAITGRTAKQVVDDRVALEARRLLACTDDSVAEVGRVLGFPEPTNFGRFFHREVGQSPGAFRMLIRESWDNHVPQQRVVDA